ncbi:unnamed protein product [Cyprideis torosa]|uniref:Uncharacterized protein n=1 Tax=Cyprideis torosa TaxID=163714 RepID=A0A7R8ZHJ9_9CRUS|nr:unnamed protein product [Cyprideis torosa]CAG0882694.1 unnamed protein product [Cyprideis torosa]
MFWWPAFVVASLIGHCSVCVDGHAEVRTVTRKSRETGGPEMSHTQGIYPRENMIEDKEDHNHDHGGFHGHNDHHHHHENEENSENHHDLKYLKVCLSELQNDLINKSSSHHDHHDDVKELAGRAASRLLKQEELMPPVRLEEAICHDLLPRIRRECFYHDESVLRDSWHGDYAWRVWLYSSVSVLIISCGGILGVVVIPIMHKVFYDRLLRFLVALAVGTLTGDAFLHLLPHADDVRRSSDSHDESAHGHSHQHSYSGLSTLAGIFLFYFAEGIVSRILAWKIRRTKRRRIPPPSPQTKGNMATSLSVYKKTADGGGGAGGCTPCKQVKRKPRRQIQRNCEGIRMGTPNLGDEDPKRRSCGYLFADGQLDEIDDDCPSATEEETGKGDNNNAECCTSITDTVRAAIHSSPSPSAPHCAAVAQTQALDEELGLCCSGSPKLQRPSTVPALACCSTTDSPSQEKVCLTQADEDFLSPADVDAHSATQSAADGEISRRTSTPKLLDNTATGAASSPLLRPAHLTAGHSHHHHNHQHSHHHHGVLRDSSMSSIAWMVILGDGLHNLTDGMAIGAAFARSYEDGISTSVAVFCHELPHEIGDFAMLLKTGMRTQQALLYNVMSSFLCCVGMCIGVMLGNIDSFSSIVFSVTAGTFLYVALVTMLPEISSNEETTVATNFIHFLGIVCGIGIMVLISRYENQFHHLLT